MRFIDPDGMAALDVTIVGSKSDEAFGQLQAAVEGELTLSKDSKGNVTYTQTNPDAVLSKDAQKLAEAIDDHSSNVIVNASSKTSTPNGGPLMGGAWLGTKLTGKTTSDGTAIVEGNQQVNPEMMGEIDAYYGKPGKSMLHEVTESYEGTKLTQITGEEYEDGTLNPGEFNTVHENASPSLLKPEDITVYPLDKNGKVLPKERMLEAYNLRAVLQAQGKKPLRLLTWKPTF